MATLAYFLFAISVVGLAIGALGCLVLGILLLCGVE